MSPEINVAIVDDESIQLESMKTLINEAATELSINVQLHYFSSGEEFLFKLDEHKNLAMVFLDIEMKNIDGLEVARKIREKDKLLTIVFATAYAEYAVQGYEVQALDYLLKPIEVDKIKRVLQRHLDRKPLLQESMTLEVNGELTKLLLDDILYVEVIRRECRIQLRDHVLIVNKSLTELSEHLNNAFIQTHRSYLVNLAHMNRLLKADVELSNRALVPVSRRLSKEVQEKFIAYHKKAVFYNE